MAYRLSPLAEQDLEEIWLYVAEDSSPTTADRLIDAIVDRFDLLEEQPAVGRARPEFGAGVRSFVVESYVIYYRHDKRSRSRECCMAIETRRRPGRSSCRHRLRSGRGAVRPGPQVQVGSWGLDTPGFYSQD